MLQSYMSRITHCAVTLSCSHAERQVQIGRGKVANCPVPQMPPQGDPASQMLTSLSASQRGVDGGGVTCDVGGFRRCSGDANK